MTEESLLTITATTGEILRSAQNDSECIYVALQLARFSAMLRMTESVFFVSAFYLTKLQFVISSEIFKAVTLLLLRQPFF